MCSPQEQVGLHRKNNNKTNTIFQQNSWNCLITTNGHNVAARNNKDVANQCLQNKQDSICNRSDQWWMHRFHTLTVVWLTGTHLSQSWLYLVTWGLSWTQINPGFRSVFVTQPMWGNVSWYHGTWDCFSFLCFIRTKLNTSTFSYSILFYILITGGKKYCILTAGFMRCYSYLRMYFVALHLFVSWGSF